MPQKTNRPMEGVPKGDRSSRRDLLKRALVLLGAGVLIQPNGGVSASAFAQETGAGGIKKKLSKKKITPIQPKTQGGNPPPPPK
jgi:hypothetical protein